MNPERISLVLTALAAVVVVLTRVRMAGERAAGRLDVPHRLVNVHTLFGVPALGLWGYFLLSDSARRQNSPPDHPRFKTAQRLLEITFEEVLRGSVFIGSPDTVVGKLKDLQRDIGLSGVQLETNCAGLADHAAEREAIRLLAQEVKSAFR